MKSSNIAVLREARAQAAGRIIGCTMFIAVALMIAPHVPIIRRIEVLAAGGFFALFALRYLWTLFRPGYLRISPEGVEQDLGWRRKNWSWEQIEDFRLVRTVPPVSVVLLRIRGSRFPIRLFGWTSPPVAIERLLRQFAPPTAS